MYTLLLTTTNVDHNRNLILRSKSIFVINFIIISTVIISDVMVIIIVIMNVTVVITADSDLLLAYVKNGGKQRLEERTKKHANVTVNFYRL